MSFSARSQSSIVNLPSEQARWLYNQAALVPELRRDIGILEKINETHKRNADVYLERINGLNETNKLLQDIQANKDRAHAIEIKGLQKSVRRQKVWKWIGIAVPTALLGFSLTR